MTPFLPFPCPPAKSARGAESFAVKVIQNFLFHLTRRQYVSPRFFFALASEQLQVMPDLEQHRLGLMLDLFEQYFPRAHVRNVSRSRAAGKPDVAGRMPALLCESVFAGSHLQAGKEAAEMDQTGV